MPEFLDQQLLNVKLAQYMRENFYNFPETHEQRSIRNRISTWSEALRKKISTFSQLPGEPFWQAWQRFDGYRNERPHHGYSDTEVLLFFYNGIEECHQDELDDDAFLEFRVQNTQTAYWLIADLAARSYDDSIEYDKMKTPESKDASPDFVEEQMNLHLGDIICTSKEEIGATSITSESELITSDTPMRMVGNQVDEVVEVTESQQGTLPMCTVAEEETKCEEVMTISCKTPSIVEAIQPPPVVEEKVIRKCGSTLRNKLATSFGDSTRLELSVKFEKTTFATSYYDSGSSLNWMTYATAQSLGFTSNHFKDTELSLEFADQSETPALGILKGLAVTVNNNINLRADFAVLALGEEFDNTIIFGEPFEWVVRFIIGVQEEDTDLHLGDNTTTSQEETGMRANELDTVGAESAEEINLQPLPEHADTLAEDFGAAESKEETPDLMEEPSLADAVKTTLVVQEEMPTSDDDPLQDQPVKEIGNAEGSELHMVTNDISTAATCHDSNSSFSAEDLTTIDTTEYAAILSSYIFESAAMPRKGPDKPKDHKVSQFYRIVHHDIEDSLARIWSMSKKGNGFPWDDGISRELELVDDPRLDNMNLWMHNLLEPYLLDQNKSRLLIRDAGKTAGIPRTGPDIPSFHEFDQSQFSRFAGEGGCITYCDVIGSVTRPPEVLLNVPVPC